MTPTRRGGGSARSTSVRITVAICTWNRCELLQQTLDRLRSIDVPAGLSWEVLVVENNCTDRTADVVRSFASRLPVRLAHEPRPGASHARNRALDEASGRYIAWIDDDVLVGDRWLTTFVAAIDRRPDVGVFGGPIEPWFPTPPDPVMLAAFPSLANGFCGLDYGNQEIALRPGQPLFTSNMVVATHVTAGLRFDPALGGTAGSGVCGEDVQFLSQITARGASVRWLPDMAVKHYVDPARMTLTYLSRFYYDRGRSAVRLRTCDGVPYAMGAPRWCWRAMAEHYARYCALRLTPMRRQALESLRQFQYARGIVAESLAQLRAQAS